MSTPTTPIELRVSGASPPYRFDLHTAALSEAAMRWSYIVGKRARWTDSVHHLEALRDRARRDLAHLGLVLPPLPDEAWLEIDIPFQSEPVGWAARIMPWEFLLRAAADRPDLAIARHLATGRPAAPAVELKKVLFVESAPGVFADRYTFEPERWLVEGSLAARSFQSLINPNFEELAAAVKRWKPQVVHLSAVDLHTAQSLTGWDWGTESRRADGVVLRALDANGRGPEAYEIVPPEALAGALTGVKVLGLNCHHSAPRIAAMAVAQGVEAAVGFQDQVADALAQRFFASFYQRLRLMQGQALDAYVESWRRIPPAEASRAGLVFWMNRGIAPAKGRRLQQTPARPLELGSGERRALMVDVLPNREINYATLHNGGGLFHKFSIYKYEPCYAHGIKVEVTLHLEGNAFRYQASFNLSADESVLDLSPSVNLPLTSALVRSLRESVLTSLHVRVLYNGREIYVNTARVTLLAVNEWRYDLASSARHLASFVLPGDPAVQRLVDAAQRVLALLEDHAHAGFDGYQSAAEDPDSVHLQARAIWSTISFQGGLAYSNPPPVFTERSQRLRTPSDIYEAGHGTCLDLTLLLAACLEYIELYPVIFLYRDHAFAGYWRSEEDYRRYLEVELAPAGAVGGTPAEGFPGLEIDEVRRLVRDGALVPLESTLLTEQKGFAAAVEAGVENLNAGAGWEALIDIRRARSEGITPLPLARPAPRSPAE